MEAVSITIFGKLYQIKCPADALESLQRAASFLEEKMSAVRASNTVLSFDRIAVITALNLAHQLMTQEDQIQDLQNTIDRVLNQQTSMEF